MPDDNTRDPRVYFAAERTLLAWIRTGIALMGFGFVVARFGLFLRELAALRVGAQVEGSAISVPVGITLIVAGVLVTVLASVRHVRLIRELNQGVPAVGKPSTLALLVALLLAAAGLAMAAYLASGFTAAPTAIHKEVPAMHSDDGIISKPSNSSVPATLDKLEAVLKSKGISIFARIDHTGEAEKVGMKMRPTQLLIFGNPKGGTPVMLAAPTSAIDLPLKALAWQDDGGKVWLSYNDPAYLQHRFGLSEDDIKTIAGIGGLIEQAVR